MQFTKATRKKAKLRLALTGPSGSGKTYSALLLAKGLGGRIAVIDTEHESASLYAGQGAMPEYETLNLAPPFTPERFIEAVSAAEAAGFDTVILDSITHEWNGAGGCLELVDEIARAKFKGNSWSAWNEVTPRHRDFLDALLRSPLHIIATMRSKTETAQTEENGRKKVVKLGMKSEQRDGFEYEMTVVLDIVHDGHCATAMKDRTGLFTGADPKPISEATGAMLLEWLESGEVAPTKVTMTEQAIADHVAAFDEAPTVESLKAKGDKAYAIADSMGDEEAKTKLAAAYKKRRAAILGKAKEPAHG